MMHGVQVTIWMITADFTEANGVMKKKADRSRLGRPVLESPVPRLPFTADPGGLAPSGWPVGDLAIDFPEVSSSAADNPCWIGAHSRTRSVDAD